MNTDFGIWNAEEEKIYEEGRKFARGGFALPTIYKLRKDRDIATQKILEAQDFDKTNKKGDMKQYYSFKKNISHMEKTQLCEDYIDEQSIGWRWCSQEMPEKGTIMTEVGKVFFSGSPQGNQWFQAGGAIPCPLQWLKGMPPLEEEKDESGFKHFKEPIMPKVIRKEPTELDNLKKRVGELEAKAGKKRSFNALVKQTRDIMQKMNELIEEEG